MNGRFSAGKVRRDEAPFGRSRAAVGGRLLRLPAAAERRERAVEADAAGRAVPELHAGGESRGMRRQEGRAGQVDVREDREPTGSENERKHEKHGGFRVFQVERVRVE